MHIFILMNVLVNKVYNLNFIKRFFIIEKSIFIDRPRRLSRCANFFELPRLQESGCVEWTEVWKNASSFPNTIFSSQAFQLAATVSGLCARLMLKGYPCFPAFL